MAKLSTKLIKKHIISSLNDDALKNISSFMGEFCPPAISVIDLTRILNHENVWSRVKKITYNGYTWRIFTCNHPMLELDNVCVCKILSDEKDENILETKFGNIYEPRDFYFCIINDLGYEETQICITLALLFDKQHIIDDENIANYVVPNDIICECESIYSTNLAPNDAEKYLQGLGFIKSDALSTLMNRKM